MKVFVLLVVLSFFLAGCSEFAPVEKPAQNDVKLCAADVMICPDGTFVTRDPANDCNYKLCSEDGYGDPARELRPEE